METGKIFFVYIKMIHFKCLRLESQAFEVYHSYFTPLEERVECVGRGGKTPVNTVTGGELVRVECYKISLRV